MWLKRWTAQNIVIGGAAGSFPPMIAGRRRQIPFDRKRDLVPDHLMWTPPHFWALALYRSKDYERAGVPMLPVVAGESETRKQILLYIRSSLCLWHSRPSSWALRRCLWRSVCHHRALMLLLAWRVYKDREGEKAEKAAKNLIAFSIHYLFLLFAVLLLEAML